MEEKDSTTIRRAVINKAIGFIKVGNEYVEIYRVVNRYQDITRIFE